MLLIWCLSGLTGCTSGAQGPPADSGEGRPLPGMDDPVGSDSAPPPNGNGNDNGEPPAPDDGDGLGPLLPGSVRSVTDERLRPIEVTGPSLTATLLWSDDSSVAVVTITSGDEIFNETFSVDFSDAALLEAVANSDQAGVELPEFRDHLIERPDDVAGFVNHLPEHEHHPTPTSEVDAYLLELTRTGLIVRATEWAVASALEGGDVTAEDEEPFRDLLRHLEVLTQDWHNLIVEQQRECAACTMVCNVTCATEPEPPDTEPEPLPPEPPASVPVPPPAPNPPTPGADACCYPSADGLETLCLDIATETECEDGLRGVHHVGFACAHPNLTCDVGACCITIFGRSVCRAITRADCQVLDDRDLVTAAFFDGQNCCDEAVQTFCGVDPRCE